MTLGVAPVLPPLPQTWLMPILARMHCPRVVPNNRAQRRCAAFIWRRDDDQAEQDLVISMTAISPLGPNRSVQEGGPGE